MKNKKTISSRTSNSIRNIKFAVIGQLISTVLSFINRTAFVYILGKEYLGVNGLFSNILAILSLAEMGIGAAIVYSLYKPLAEHNDELIVSLMRLFKRIYTAIGCFIIVAGSILIPILDFFVSKRPNISHFEFIYFLFVLNNAAGYFFSYKGMIINADQKQYITTTVTQISTLVMCAFQVVILLATKNYILYLFVMLFCTIGKNLVISIVADRMYPIIKTKVVSKLPTESVSEIKNNVKAMMMHKIGGVIVDSTDNILISKLVNIVSVGIYSNYYMIIHMLATIYSMLFNALIASVGNLGVLENENKVYENFKLIDFAGRWLYFFSFVCLLNLFNPFIGICNSL